MNRDALIIGINKYPFLKVNGKLQNLTTPASDAEKIAQILETKGEFRVRRLPVKLSEGNHQIDSDSTLKAEELQDAIGQLFNPEGENAPHTALLYFIGHGLREVSYGVTEGFLATSDVNPGRNQWGVRLKWLRELLQKSPVKEQIIWLDCCYSGELFNFTEADLGTGNQEQTRFFIAASREYELAEANVFSRTLWEGLNPNNNSEGLVDNDTLISYLKEHLKNAPQQPIFANPNRQILLTGTQGETIFTSIDGDCPYKGLLFFDVDDADYFYGRERLTQELIDKVQVGKANFLAVLGVSGSGKSSLLRAGLIYQLQHKDRLPQTQSWKISIFTPGEKPLDSLAIAFLEKEWTDGQRYEELQRVKQVIDKGATGFADYIKVSQAPRTLLIVDQFEETFTVCESPKDRTHFITTLLGALQQTGDKLCLIFAMRDDFLGKCAVYQELATLIQSNLLMVTPMNEGELRDAIAKPAIQLGHKVEPNLIDAMLKDLGVESSEDETPEAEPGLLPLLSYTLEQLWYRQTLNWLRLDSYNDLGGVRQTLENLAEETYKGLSETEQRIANQIFIKLTQLGERTDVKDLQQGQYLQNKIPDTRRQIRMDALVSSGESEELVKQVVQKLADARLIVTSDPLPKKGVVIDVAHEALIRYWGRLRELLKKSREAIRTERKIETAAQEWRDRGKDRDYLLQGKQLTEAKAFQKKYADDLLLSNLTENFIRESVKQRRWNRLKIASVITIPILISMSFAEVKENPVLAASLLTIPVLLAYLVIEPMLRRERVQQAREQVRQGGDGTREAIEFLVKGCWKHQQYSWMPKFLLEKLFGSCIGLEGYDLQIANLRGANLRSANLRSSNLCRADFRTANLRNTDLRNTNLRHANFLRSADLRNADLRNADLRNAHLSSANLRGADLRGADLRSADLSVANLSNALLSDADLRGASLSQSNLEGARYLIASKLAEVAPDVPKQPPLSVEIKPHEIVKVMTNQYKGGFGYRYIGFGLELSVPDDLETPNVSRLVLLEDGIPLTPSHASHDEIQRIGKGRYSHWDDGNMEYLYFSTSDNSDPRINQRTYAVTVTE